MKLSYLRNTVPIVLSISLFIGCSGEPETSNKETKSETVAKVDKSNWRTNKGVGTITMVNLDSEIDETLSEEGKAIFELKCSACHKVDKKYIGPSPQDILDRRTPEWIMNMILNPEKMVAEDPIAKQLMIEYNGTPMANQNLTEEEARAILEFFRTLNSN